MSAWAESAFRVRVPATSANLGPGFDTLGLALSLHDELQVRVTPAGLDLDVTGEGAAEVADAGDMHLVVRTMRATFDALGVSQPPGLALRCVNRIPHGRGLGSSAAAIVAGILAARALVGADTSADAALPLASELEGHPDNVAPCLYGGLTIAWLSSPRGAAGASEHGNPPEGTVSGPRGPAGASERGTPREGTASSPRGGASASEAGTPSEAMVSGPRGAASASERGAPGEGTASVPRGGASASERSFERSGELRGTPALSWGPAGEPDTTAGRPEGGGSGGLVYTPQKARARAIRLDPLPGITPVVIIAPAPVSTEVARGLLPERVAHADAARNAGRAALLVAALTARPDALLDATEDWLHQDYRAPAMPRTHDLVSRLRAAGIPAVVSGAGPSVLAFVQAAVPGRAVVDSGVLDSTVRETGIGWLISSLDVERQGASVAPVVPSVR